MLWGKVSCENDSPSYTCKLSLLLPRNRVHLRQPCQRGAKRVSRALTATWATDSAAENKCEGALGTVGEAPPVPVLLPSPLGPCRQAFVAAVASYHLPTCTSLLLAHCSHLSDLLRPLPSVNLHVLPFLLCFWLTMTWLINSEKASSEPGTYKQDMQSLEVKLKMPCSVDSQKWNMESYTPGLRPGSEIYQPETQGNLPKLLNLPSITTGRLG